MKDKKKELIAAFKCCAKLDCRSCPFIRDFESCDRLEESILDLINSQNAEIERLNKVEYVLPARHCGKKLMVRFRLRDIRAEAIKELAKRLKEEYRGFDETHHQIFYSSLVACIDNLVKEMVGDHDV